MDAADKLLVEELERRIAKAVFDLLENEDKGSCVASVSFGDIKIDPAGAAPGDYTVIDGRSGHRTGSAKAGPQTAKLVPCGRSQWHGHHPANEPCPLCGPGQAAPARGEPEWIVHIDSGCLYDLTKFSAGAAKNMRASYDYMPLQNVCRDGLTAKRICGCYYPPYTCERYVDDRNIPITACSMPSVVKDPKWRKV